MPTNHSPQDFLPLKHDVVLILLAIADTPRHGYGIMQEITRRSHGDEELQAGALYRHLKRLLGDGLIAECAPPAGSTSDSRRRFYKVTALGKSVLGAELERMDKLVRAARARGATRPRLA